MANEYNYQQPENSEEIKRQQVQQRNNLFSSFFRTGFNFFRRTSKGKVAEAGAKKVAVATSAKVGLTAIPEPTVSKIILIASFAKDLLQKIGSGVKNLLFKVRDKPEFLIASGAILVTIPLIVPLFSIISGLMTAVGAVSAAAGVIGGASKLIGGITSKVSNFLSGAAHLTGNLIAGVTGATISPTLLVMAVPGAVLGVGVGTLFTNLVTSSAFMITPETTAELNSSFINVTKTAAFAGNAGQPITYTIRVEASGKDLTNVNIIDTATATCIGTPPTLENHNWSGISITNGNAWESSYTVNTSSPSFDDCLISNSVEVTATTDAGNERSVDTEFVSIGNPPVVIPQGLPINSQDNPTRGTGYTYRDPLNPGHNGIDVNGRNSSGTRVPVYSTFPGESIVVFAQKNEQASTYGCGYYITLSAGQYQIMMCHLADPPTLNVGDKVGGFAQVGIQGDTGNSFGAHVHYVIYKDGLAVDPRNYGVPSPPW